MENALHELKDNVIQNYIYPISAFKFFGGYKTDARNQGSLDKFFWVLDNDKYMLIPKYYFEGYQKFYDYKDDINVIRKFLTCKTENTIERKEIYDIEQFKFLENIKIIIDKDFKNFTSLYKTPAYWLRGKPVNKSQAKDIIYQFDKLFENINKEYVYNEIFNMDLFSKGNFGFCKTDGRIAIDSFFENIIREAINIDYYILNCIKLLYKIPYMDFVFIVWKFDDKVNFEYHINNIIKKNPSEYIECGVYVHDKIIEILSPDNAWEKFSEYDNLYNKSGKQMNYYEYDNYLIENFPKDIDILFRKYETNLFDFLCCYSVDEDSFDKEKENASAYTKYKDKYIILPKNLENQIIIDDKNAVNKYILSKSFSACGTYPYIKSDYLPYLKEIKITFDAGFTAFDSSCRRAEFWLRGKPVTPEQACDIISKIDSAFSNSSDSIGTYFLDTKWFSKNIYGWCRPDGRIGINGITHKYPNVMEYIEEFVKLICNFPYLDMIFIMWNGDEGGYFRENLGYVMNGNPSRNIDCGIYIHDKQIEFLNPDNAWVIFNKYNNLYGGETLKYLHDYHSATNQTVCDTEFYNKCLEKNNIDSKDIYAFNNLADTIPMLYEKSLRELIFKKWERFSWCK